MDLNLLRAVVSAHRAGQRNAVSRKLIWFLLILLIPMAGSFFALGLDLGAQVGSLDPALAGRWLIGVTLILGVFSGLWDGTYTLRFEPLRPLLPRPIEVFLAELLLGLVTVPKLYVGSLALALGLGLTWAHPSFAPWAFFGLLLGGLWWVCLERLVGALSRVLGKRFKLLVLFTGLFLAVRMLFVNLGLAPARFSAWAEQRHLPTSFTGHVWPILWSGHHLTGNLGVLTRFIFAPVLWTVLLGTVTAAVLWRDLGNPALEHSERPPRLWRFHRPWVGIARHQWAQLWTSKVGLIRLFLPLYAIFLIKTPAMVEMRSGSTWIVFSLGYFQCAVSGGPLFNLFGFDRGAVRTFWTFPVEDGIWLMGKVLGIWVYQATFTLLMAALMMMLSPLPLVVAGPAALFSVALFLFHAAIGITLSVQAPSPLDTAKWLPGSFNAAKLVRLPGIFMPLVGLLVLWAWTSRHGATWLLAGQGLAVLLGAFALTQGLSSAKALVTVRRDELTLILEGHAVEDPAMESMPTGA